MRLIDSINNIYKKWLIKRNSTFNYPISAQRAFLVRLGEPNDDIERSYFQFRCQMKLDGLIMTVVENIASIPLIILYRKKGTENIEHEESYDAVFFPDGKPKTIIPKTVKEKFNHILICDDKKAVVTDRGLAFYKRLRIRYPFSFNFLLKCLIKIEYYDYVIAKYSPKAIITCSEYSFTSSVLTEYCKEQGVEHIDIMHGEKLYTIHDSYFRFTNCYVWDQHYIDLFDQLKAPREQFVIATPESMKFQQNMIIVKKCDFTYYLGDELEEGIAKVVDLMKSIAELGYVVAIRPHPRFTNLAILKKLLNNESIEVEDCSQISIEYSIMRTRHVVSVYSTVLNQAYCNGVCVVIDNLSNPKNYKKLKELQYIMLSKEHELLSDYLKG